MTNLLKTILASAFLAFSALPSTAQVQELLVNGDFETDPLPIGEHASTNFTGWNSLRVGGASGSSPFMKGGALRIVGVANGQPASAKPINDADGVNGLRHYADAFSYVGGSSNPTYYSWQHITAPCSGVAQASIAFSAREWRDYGKFSVARRMGPPLAQPDSINTSVSAQVTTVLNEQNFQTVSLANNPTGEWVNGSQAVQLNSGELYTFMVEMREPTNFDNASLVIDCPLTPPLDTEQTSIQKVCEAPVQGTHNGQLGQLWTCRINVNASPAPFAGTLTVNDTPSQNTGNTSTEIVSMTSADTGVDCSAGQSCLVDGATFDGNGVIDVQTFVSTTGDAPSFTSQNCASGNYTNGAEPVAINGNCVQASFTPRVSSTKVCDPIEPVTSGPMTLNCRISVAGSNLPTNGFATVLDVFGAASGSANVVGTMMNMTSNENWSCIDIPNQPNTGVCELSALDLYNAGGSSTMNVSFQFEAGSDTRQVINCGPSLVSNVSYVAAVGQQKSAQKSAFNSDNLPDYCAAIDVPPVKLPPLKEASVVKECGRPEEGEIKDQRGLIWKCKITVEATPVPFSGSFTLNEDASALSGSGNGNIVSLDPVNPAWQCQQNLPAQMSSCQIAGTDFSTSGSEVVEVTLFVQPGEKPVDWKNCVSGTYVPQMGEKQNFSGNCEGMTWKPDVNDGKETTFKINKVCEPRGKRHVLKPGTWFQPYRCAITVTTNGVPFNFPILVSDDLQFGSNQAWQSITALSSSDPWACSPNLPQSQNAPWCWINGNQFPHAAGTSTINVDMLLSSAAEPTGAENCGQLFAMSVSGDEPKPLGESCTTIIETPVDEEKPSLSVNKVCAQPTRNGANWDVACTVTISGNNLPAGTPIRLSDDMQSISGYTATAGQFQSSLAQCGGNTTGTGVYAACDLSSDDLANGPIVFNYSGTFVSQTIQGEPQTAQNCAYADAPSLNLHAPTGGDGKVCVPLVLGDPIDIVSIAKPNLSITKKQAGLCIAGTPCRFDFTIENTGNTTMNVPQIVDEMTPSNGVSVHSASAPFICTASGGRIICNPSSAITLAPGDSHSMNVQLVLPQKAQGEYRNCALLNWSPYEIAYSDRSVRSVQQALANKGYNPGAVDGAMGRNTRNAIRSFQRDNGLAETGEMNERSASLLFGRIESIKRGDINSSDDRSCVGVEYQEGEEQHSKSKSELEQHSTYKSALVSFHRTYSSAEHDRKRTSRIHNRAKSVDDSHDKRVSRVHRKHRSSQHNAKTTKIIEQHSKRQSRLDEFHRKYRSRQHDRKVTRNIHDKRLSRFHNRFKSAEHDRRTTRRLETHSKSQSAIEVFHRKFKSSQHDQKRTRLRHDKTRSRLAEFHKKFKSNQHDRRSTKVVHDRRKSREQNHDKRLSRFHSRFKSGEHNRRTTRRLETHSKSKSAIVIFHRKFKSSQHDRKRTRLRHDRLRSRLVEVHKKFKSSQHDGRRTIIRQTDKPRPVIKPKP